MTTRLTDEMRATIEQEIKAKYDEMSSAAGRVDWDPIASLCSDA